MKLHELKEAAALPGLMGRMVYNQVELEDIPAIISKHCRNSISNLQDKHFLYRGDRNANFFTSAAIVDPTRSSRKSQNTTNFYTLILDNTSSMREFPKRSNSLICSTHANKAQAYSKDGLAESGMFIVVPFDDVKIGCVNHDDIWDVQMDSLAPGRPSSLLHMNDMWRHFGNFLSKKNLDSISQYDWTSFEKVDQLLRENDDAVKCLQSAFSIKSADLQMFREQGFLKRIDEIYSPSKLGFDVTSAPSYPWYKGEQWVGGKCLLIKHEEYPKIESAIMDI